jgi:uncharacterized protein YidB (DUF937 family)
MSDILGRVLGGLMQGQGAQQPQAGGLGGLLGQLLGGGDQSVSGLNGMAEQLRQAGLGRQVDSWIGTGANEPVDPDALAGALGRDHVNNLAQQSGVSGSGLAGTLAALLPVLINAMTPQGRVPQSAAELPQGGGLAALLGGAGQQGGGGAGLGALMGALSGQGGAAGGAAAGLGALLGGAAGGGPARQGGSVSRDGLADGAAYGKNAPGRSGGMKD